MTLRSIIAWAMAIMAVAIPSTWAPASAKNPFLVPPHIPIAQPQGLAVNPTGELYVANYNYNTGEILVYKDDRQVPVRTITLGVANPQGLAFDAAGYLYEADATLNAVNVFTPTGTWIPSRTIHTDPLSPNGVQVDRYGRVWVTFASAGEIEIFAHDGRFITTVNQGLSTPTAVAFAKNGAVWVVASYDNLAVFNLSEQLLATVVPPEFTTLVGIALDERGFIYVTDTNLQGVDIFNEAGTQIGSFVTGSFPANPHGIAITKAGYVYVANYSSNTVNKYTANGTFVAQLP